METGWGAGKGASDGGGRMTAAGGGVTAGGGATAGGGGTAVPSVGKEAGAGGCAVEVTGAAIATLLATGADATFPPWLLLSIMCLWISCRFSPLKRELTSHVATTLARAL